MKLIRSIALTAALTSSITFATENNLNCQNVIDFSDYKGQTYLSFMQETVKPLLDEYATDGYILKGRDAVKIALKNVSSKVRRKAIRSAGGYEELLSLADQLEGHTTNLYELPNLIASFAPRSNRYTLSTFFGLVSCGGAIIKYSDNHIAYNIHYGTGENAKDNRTGRSFGEGIERDADDASDKNYLKDLEEFVTEHESSLDDFYQTLIKSLANSDASNFEKVSPFGQTLLTDFLAVYTAEQARNLMDDRIHTHWDAALLEVTLMGAFHAGQEEIKLFYKDPYTGKSEFSSEVFHQDTGCSDSERRIRGARLYDYWQFSSSTNPEHCRRSGINITKREFRKLGKIISEYQRAHNPELVRRVERHFTGLRRNKNIFNQLSKFFINEYTPESLEPTDANLLAKDFVDFLLQVKKDAPAITRYIEQL